MKKSKEKMILSTLCAALLCGGLLQPLAAQAAEPVKEEVRKEETVYILTDAAGDAKEIIVSDWLKNPSGASVISDRSELTNVENVKGEEGYTEEDGNLKIWDARGGDIYYQGTIDKELPVKVSVSYKLDGKAISPEELAGKSGRVTIRYEYANRQFEYADIKGVRTRICVPFAALTGVLLDDDIFTNIQVTDGKLVNDGGMTMAAGIAFPGLRESLDISPEKLELPESMEISADVKNYEPETAYILVTNQFFSEIDADGTDSEEDLRNLLNELTDAMDQLKDGSSQLYDGLCTLLDKSGELGKGADQLASGAAELRTGAGDLDDGASRLQNGAASLQSGLNTLTANNGQLNNGAKQVFETLLATAQSQLSAQLSPVGVSVPSITIDNYADVLNNIIGSLDGAAYQKALENVTAEVEKKRPAIEAAITEAVRAQVDAQVTESVKGQVTAAVLASLNLTEEALADEAVKAQVDAAVQQQLAGTQDQIAAAAEAQMQTDPVKELIASNTESKIQELISQNMQTNPEVQNALASASEGVKAVASLKASLDNYQTFYRGLQSYTAGVAQAAAGAGSLKSGTDELKNGTGRLSSGAAQLQDGIKTLQSSIPALKDGIEQLRDGAAALSEGLDEFDEKAVQKLIDAVDGDLESLTQRIQAVSDASRRYDSFSGISDDMAGSVKFIYRIGAVKEEQ